MGCGGDEFLLSGKTLFCRYQGVSYKTAADQEEEQDSGSVYEKVEKPGYEKPCTGSGLIEKKDQLFISVLLPGDQHGGKVGIILFPFDMKERAHCYF